MKQTPGYVGFPTRQKALTHYLDIYVKGDTFDVYDGWSGFSSDNVAPSDLETVVQNAVSMSDRMQGK